MKTPYDIEKHLEELVQRAALNSGVFCQEFDPQIRVADPRFGDFQANGVLPYAKKFRKNPRELGMALEQAVRADDDFSEAAMKIELAGPGFLNFRLTAAFLSQWTAHYAKREQFEESFITPQRGKKVIVDFSSPNTAKQMHVGHIRSTVIGEALARLLSYAGADVTRDNHIGDWGTQFGILLLAWERYQFSFGPDPTQALSDLENLYRKGNRDTEENPDLRQKAREKLVQLQEGDPASLAIWEEINRVSNRAFQEVYDRLGVHFDLTLGESFYRSSLDQVYRELLDTGIACESEGALVVFHPEHPRFKEQPFIIRKSDGASNYASTDLATVFYRTEELGAEEIIYVTDGRQQDHFEQLFLTVQKWYAATGRTVPSLRHVWFGTILGPDGKAIKTRSGESVKLRDLLDEGVERARAILKEKKPDATEEEQTKISEAVGISAIRYADLMQNRTQDYLFSWDKMLSFEGNTAPYLLYAVARIHAIYRKADVEPGDGEEKASEFETAEELVLARKLITFPTVLQQVLQDLRPHHLCTYLYELADVFSTFYNANRVMGEPVDIQARRLRLCGRTLTVLETGLDLLGIQTLNKM